MAPRTARSLMLWTALASATFAFAAAKLADHVDPRSGVPIKFDLTANMFPASWTDDEIHATAIAISDTQINRSVSITDTAMAKYPAELLTKNLKAVYYVKEMRFYGLRYGGTNSRDTIYISNRGPVMGFSDKFVESTFHHEFSSILLRNFREQFDETAWKTANKPGEKYGTNGMQALKEGKADTRYNSGSHENGFLNQYGQASVEEDFNTFSEALFIGDAKYWQAVSRYPRVKVKSDMIIAFFQSVDPQFTESYFLSLVN